MFASMQLMIVYSCFNMIEWAQVYCILWMRSTLSVASSDNDRMHDCSFLVIVDGCEVLIVA